MTSWHSYPKIYNLGHKYISDLLEGEVVVQEKVDGSQFSFGLFDGVLKIRSRGQEMDVGEPEKMFHQAVAYVKSIADLLQDGFTYRGEYLQKPKHNTLCYDRIPKNHIVLFDINPSEESYLPPEMLYEEAYRLGLESVPLLYVGPGNSLTLETFKEWMNLVSHLGGQKIEGIVVKNYARFGDDKKCLMGKHVSEAFKEVHGGDWRERNPTKGDIIDQMCLKYRTPARWAKAVQHLKEAGKLASEPKDIGMLMKEVHRDLAEECANEIKELLFLNLFPKIQKASAVGLPEWYKEQLAKEQFNGK